jgi:acyl carrier protein
VVAGDVPEVHSLDRYRVNFGFPQLSPPGDGANIKIMDELTTVDAAEEQHLAQIRDVIANLLSTSAERVENTPDLLAEFGIDSLVLIDLFIRLERAFGISISEDNIPLVSTLRSVYSIVAERAGWVACRPK